MPEIGDIFKLALEFEDAGGNKFFNIFDFLLEDGACSDTQLLTNIGVLVNACYAHLNTAIVSAIDANNSPVWQMVWSGVAWNTFRYVGMVSPVTNFANASECLPYQTSALVKFLTTLPRLVPKKYLPPFGEDRQAGSYIIAATLTDLANYASTLLGGQDAGDGHLTYVVRTKAGGTEVPYGSAVPSILSSQRRRKIGVGI